ncbi:MAG: RNA chaperone Hfq [Clostridia bacterium]
MNCNTRDTFLKELSENRRCVTIFLVSGYQIHGVIVEYDDVSIKVCCNGRYQLVFMNVISTVDPG